MPLNDKQPTLEPVQYDDKDPIGTVFLLLAILVWALGGVVTVFAVLAKLGIGTFTDIFVDAFPNGLEIVHIVTMGVSVLFAGLALMTVSTVIRLLKRNATTVYAIRGLEQVIPQSVEVAGFDPESFAAAREGLEPGEGEGEPDAGRRQFDASGIQITVNVNPPAGEERPVPVTVSTSPIGEAPVPETPVEENTVPEETAQSEVDSSTDL